jgi:hypothetical protein
VSRSLAKNRTVRFGKFDRLQIPLAEEVLAELEKYLGRDSPPQILILP